MSITNYDLKGWGAIAEFLGVSIKTARIWRKTSDLPVFQGRKRGAVISSTHLITKWASNRAKTEYMGKTI